jgi:hypothetical protein
MFLIKYTLDSTRTDYTKKCGNKLFCTKKATLE